MFITVLILSLVSGCRDKPVGPEIATDSIYASMHLECVGDGTTGVKVVLSVSGSSGPHITLDGNNKLGVEANGQYQLLAEEEDWPNKVHHLAALGVDDPGTEVTIPFERTNYASALDTKVVLPEDIVIQSPQTDETFTRQGDITVSWDPSGVSQEMSISFDISCRDDGDIRSEVKNYAVSDSGSETYSVEDLLSGLSLGSGASCTVKITLVRTTTGSLSTEYRGGSIVAQREASVSVKTAP
jgi:hypothetical protein